MDGGERLFTYTYRETEKSQAGLNDDACHIMELPEWEGRGKTKW